MVRVERGNEGFASLQARLISILDTLHTENPKALGKHCYITIRQELLRARLLPPDKVTFQRWFRTACRHSDGTEYSRSQRAIFVQQFNLVGQRWAEERLVPEPLQVANYRRRRPGGVADPRVYQTIRPSEVRRLKEAFLRHLERPPQKASPQEEYWEAFCRLAFALIVWGGMAWPGALTTLASLKWKHLRTAVQGFIRIPRRGVWLRLYIPPLVQAFVLVLGMHLPRRRKFSEPSPEQPILPVSEQADDAANERRRLLRMARIRFNTWLQELCHIAGVRVISLHTLQQAVRPMLAETYGNVLAGAILGLTLYAPVPDGQEDVFDTYREPFTLPAVLPRKATTLSPTPSPQPRVMGEEPENYRLERLIAHLREASRFLATAEPGYRVASAAALEELARELLGASMEDDLSDAFARARERVDTVAFNVAVLAAWLAHLCRDTRLKPLTLIAYRSAGSALIRHFTGVRWDELDTEDVREIAALPISEGSRSRLLTVMGQVAEYLREGLGMKGAVLDRTGVRLCRKLRPVNLISQKDVERLLAHLAAQEREALEEGDEPKTGTRPCAPTQLMHNAFLAVLMAYFFGLRLSEIPRLRLGDVVIYARLPYLRVWRSKRGRSRVVWARYVPPEVISLLRDEWQRRWEATGADPAAPFLDYKGDERSFADTLGKVVNAAIRELGMQGVPEALPVTFHTLRHIYANRLLVLGVSLLEIARSMGHADTDTTTGSYLHAFDYLQRKRLEKIMAAQPKMGLTAAQIGASLGIGRTAVLAALKKLPAASKGDWWDGDRHLYPWKTVVRLLACRQKMEG